MWLVDCCWGWGGGAILTKGVSRSGNSIAMIGSLYLIRSILLFSGPASLPLLQLGQPSSSWTSFPFPFFGYQNRKLVLAVPDKPESQFYQPSGLLQVQRRYVLLDLEHNKKMGDLKKKMFTQGIKTFFSGNWALQWFKIDAYIIISTSKDDNCLFPHL